MQAGVPGLSMPSFRRRVAVSVLGTVVVAAVLAAVLAGRSGQFTAALHSAPIWVLTVVALLQVLALLARSEAWNVAVRAAGGTVPRRLLYRAASAGYLASQANGSLGLATRIASLRRLAPQSCPRVPAMMAVEVPIISVEVALAALFSFTLVGPLGVPWWAPVIAVALVVGALTVLGRLSHKHRVGPWAGLAVMRSGRLKMIGFVVGSVVLQIARNWIVLRALGVNASVLDAVAVLIAMFTLGQLPIGPSVGAAAAVLILGTNGVAATAAAGVLLAATGAVGALLYGGWALTDRVFSGAYPRTPRVAGASTPA
jgi:uncharacterized membrane protein YbhN (UPF0104 family)